MDLHLSDIAKNKVNDAILISGSGRSGTTIIGKLLHSFKGVEYTFEPPTLVTLMPLINTLDQASWKILYETYLYEDMFINAISGRFINTNLADDSSIYNVKSNEEIESRLKQSIRKANAEGTAKSNTIAYKLPNVVPYIPKLQEYFPGTRVLIMKRDAKSTISSLIEKQWFSDESVKTAVVWPHRKYEGVHVPSWVKEGDDDKWLHMSEVDRCAYYYIRVNENTELIKNRIDLRYRELLDNPLQSAKALAEFFNLSFGDKTPEIIDSIKPVKKNWDSDILDKVSPSLIESVTYYSNQS